VIVIVVVVTDFDFLLKDCWVGDSISFWIWNLKDKMQRLLTSSESTYQSTLKFECICIVFFDDWLQIFIFFCWYQPPHSSEVQCDSHVRSVECVFGIFGCLVNFILCQYDDITFRNEFRIQPKPKHQRLNQQPNNEDNIIGKKTGILCQCFKRFFLCWLLCSFSQEKYFWVAIIKFDFNITRDKEIASPFETKIH
jgi:hypothetical protein